MKFHEMPIKIPANIPDPHGFRVAYPVWVPLTINHDNTKYVGSVVIERGRNGFRFSGKVSRSAQTLIDLGCKINAASDICGGLITVKSLAIMTREFRDE